jgi:hypothetical protein
MDNEVACESTAEGLLLIAKNAPIWRRLTGILGYNQSVEDAVVDLYTQILGFLKPAIRRFQKSPLGKSGHNYVTRTHRSVFCKSHKFMLCSWADVCQ